MYRFPYESLGKRGTRAWIEFLWACNDIAVAQGGEKLFGLPVLHETWGGQERVCEEYPEARVLRPLTKLCNLGRGNEEGVRFVPLSDRARAIMAEAWRQQENAS